MTLKSLSQSVLYFLILIIVFWSKELFFEAQQYDMLLSVENSFSGYSFIANYIFDKVNSFGVVGDVFTMMLTMINAFFISRILLRFTTNTPKSFVSILIYLCLISTSFLIRDNVVNQIIAFFMLSSCERQLFVQKNYSPVNYSFLAALNIGMAAVLAPVYYCFFLAMIFTLWISGVLRFKEASAAAVGLVAPLVLVSYVQWVFDGQFFMLIDSVRLFYSEAFLRISLNIYNYDVVDYVFGSILFLLSVIGIATFIKYNISNNTKFEYTYYQFLVTNIIALFLLLFFFSSAVSIAPVFFIGMTSVISTLVVQTKKKFFRTVVVMIVILFSLVINLLSYL